MKRANTMASQVAELRYRLAAWRNNRTQRTHRGPVPDVFWSSAVALAKTEGVSRIARASGLNYDQLRKRVATAGSAGRAEWASPAFVELSWPAPKNTSPTCTLELENRSGAKMRVHFSGGLAEVVALAQAFWKQGR